MQKKLVIQPVPQSVGDALAEGYAEDQSSHNLPSSTEVVRLIEDVREVLFPGFVGPRTPPADARAFLATRLEEIRARLRLQIYHGLHHRCALEGRDCDECECPADDAALGLVSRLPELRRLLAADVQAAMDGDPAAKGPDEVIFCYPGFYAVTVYRLANLLYRALVPIIPRMMTEHAHQVTGIDIHPGATIGESFFIDHGTGVVIGETTNIGNGVRIYQGVTLGALSLSKENTAELRGHKRHPTIEDGVIIYANATILGGRTVIGKNAIIGGNCWITRSVSPGSKVSFRDTNGG